MYRVFEALDELVVIVEESRGVPMTAGCVVPRGNVLDLLDDIKESLPPEMDDAQDVLDRRDTLINDARASAEHAVDRANEHAETTLADARDQADRIVSDAKAQADRMVQDAQHHSAELVASAEATADRAISDGRREYEMLTGRAKTEADRIMEAGNASYERSIAEGQAEQARLVSQSEVVQAAHAESARVIDEAHAESDRLRGDCDIYVDTKLLEFEDLLSGTLRSVGRGRQQLRSTGSPDFGSGFASGGH